MATASPWLKRVLIPFWVVQILLMVFVIAIMIGILVDDIRSFALSEYLVLALALITAALLLTEIILHWRQRLKPLTYLVLQMVKTAIWFFLFLFILIRGISKQQGKDKVDNTYTAGAGVFGLVFFAFLGSLIYGSVIYHRQRRIQRQSAVPNNAANSYYPGPYGNNDWAKSGQQGSYQPLNSPYHTPAPINGGEVPASTTAAESDGLMSPGAATTAELTSPIYGPAAELRSPGYGDFGRMELKGGEVRNELQPSAEVFELSGGERYSSGRANQR